MSPHQLGERFLRAPLPVPDQIPIVRFHSVYTRECPPPSRIRTGLPHPPDRPMPP
jgi:hypothetical protein